MTTPHEIDQVITDGSQRDFRHLFPRRARGIPPDTVNYALLRSLESGSYWHFHYLVTCPFANEENVHMYNAYLLRKAAYAPDIRFLELLLAQPYTTRAHLFSHDAEAYQLAAYHNRYFHLKRLVSAGACPEQKQWIQKSKALEMARKRNSHECVGYIERILQ